MDSCRSTPVRRGTTVAARLITPGGPTLVYTARVTGFGGPDVAPAIQRAMTAALPAGWHAGLTGSQLLMNGQSPSKGTGIMAEAMIGAAGSLVILALLFGSFLAFLPLII